MLRPLVIIVLVLLVLLAGTMGYFYWRLEGLPAGAAPEPGQPAAAPPPRDIGLPVGEELVYALMWKGLAAGETTFRVIEKLPLNASPPLLPGEQRLPPRLRAGPEPLVYHVQMRVRSRGALNAVFAIDNRIESWIDARTGASQRFLRHVREGTFDIYKADERLDFDYDENLAYLSRVKHKDAGPILKHSEPRPIPGPLQDTFSILYYVRHDPLAPGEEREVTVSTRRETATVVLTAAAQTETLTIPEVGSFEALRIRFGTKDPAALKEKVQVFLKEGELELQVEAATNIPLRLYVSEIPVLGEAEALLRGARRSPLADHLADAEPGAPTPAE
jgi:hypothetical protein